MSRPRVIPRFPIVLQPSLSALRPDDLLSLQITWRNLTLKDGRLLRDPRARDALLIVELEPQHIAEQAHFEFFPNFTFPPPIDPAQPDRDSTHTGADPVLPQPGERIPARIADRSRLAFVVPPSTTEITCTFEGLLRAISDLPLNVDARALPPPEEPRARPTGRQPLEAKPPTTDETSIEAPWRLILSPNEFGAWLHALAPVEGSSSGRVELWHTRLGTRPRATPDPASVVHDGRYPYVRQPDGSRKVSKIAPEPQERDRTVRVLWSPDYEAPPTPPPEHDPVGPTRTFHPFRAALDPRDRHELVRLTSTGVSDWPNRTVAAHRLMLSTLGAWLDLDYLHDRDPEHPELTIESWRHRAMLGRDAYVRVVYAGFLCPFRHHASLIKVTERKFETRPPATPEALLRQRLYVVVRQHEVSIPADERRMPFRTVRVTTSTTPDLDPPNSGPGVITGNQSAFCPHVGGKPFLFHVVAEDWEGRSCDFAAPLVFLDTWTPMRTMSTPS